MVDQGDFNYSRLDIPEVLMRLFHPRPEMRLFTPPGDATDLMIPVEDGVAVGARLHLAGLAAPTLLFFHGNGEIVADYDELGPFYVKMGINFLPVDYRGYGRSGGSPTVAAMMRDGHAVFAYVRQWLRDQGHTGPLAVMGRSLGSAPALELASRYPEEVDGLIIESGFAYVAPLLELLGVNVAALGLHEATGFNLDKIRHYGGPTLIIHAQGDHIIPVGDGRALYEASPAADKTLLIIPGANHNDLMLVGFKDYLAAIGSLVKKLRG